MSTDWFLLSRVLHVWSGEDAACAVWEKCCMCRLGADMIAFAASARPAGLRWLLKEGQWLAS